MSSTILVDAQSAALKDTQFSGVLRLQWSDTQGRNSRDGFETRLARLIAVAPLDARTTGRIMVEFASGTTARSADLLDAFITWRADAQTTVYAGQMRLPLSYDIRAGIITLDVPERTLMVGAYFAGVRSQGVYAARLLDRNNTLELGVWNSLTINDPQANVRGGEGAYIGTFSWRYRQGGTQLALGGAVGRRPGFATRDSVGNPIVVADADRRAFYVEFEQRVSSAPLTLRAIYLAGRDRNPVGGLTAPQFTEASDYRDWVAYAIYNLTARHQLALRWEDFDPDTARPNDQRQALAIVYHYFPEENIRMSLSYERFLEQGASVDNDRIIAAVQYRF
ncbi:MAG: porin [Fimbriimonadales bacterium]